MGTGTEDAVKTLNHLVRTCRDGEESYRTAATGIDDDTARSLLEQRARERAEMAEQLQDAVLRLGGDPGGKGPTAAYRGWLNIKSAISRDDTLGVLEECERGEDYTRSVFKEALDVDLPPDIRPLVHQQLSMVETAHDQIRSLRDAKRRAS